jgi:hypothetical protein
VSCAPQTRDVENVASRPIAIPLVGQSNGTFFRDASAFDLTKNEISQLPDKRAEKKLDYDAKEIFDKPDTAKLKKDKTLNDAGDFLQDNRFGGAVGRNHHRSRSQFSIAEAGGQRPGRQPPCSQEHHRSGLGKRYAFEMRRSWSVRG